MKRRAFALVYAITALALLGALAALVVVGMQQGVQNSVREQQAAQLRQLVLAGVQLASRGENGPVALPTDLPRDASLVIRKTEDGKSVEAKLGGASLEIQLQPSAGKTGTPR